MNTRALRFLSLPLAAALASAFALSAQVPAEAQDAALKSGPPAGMVLTPVSVYAPMGPRKGQTFDAAKAIGEGPGALLFVHTVNREVAPLLRGLDSMGLEYSIFGFKSFTVSLADDRTETEEAVRRYSTGLRMRNPMVVTTDGAEGPGDYALNRKAYLTLVLVNKGKVHRSVAITDTGAKDLPKLRKWIEEVTGKLPKNAAELMQRLPDDPAKLKKLVAELHAELKRQAEQAARQQRNRRDRQRRGRGRNRGRGRDMERGRGRDAGRGRGQDQPPTSRPTPRPAGKLAGKIPDDGKLQGLMRGMIGRLNTKEDVDGLFQQVDERVSADKDLQQQAVEGFKRLLANPWGTEYARKRFQAYVDKHGKQPARKKL